MKGLNEYENFRGMVNSSGSLFKLDSTLGYDFNRYLGVFAGVPLYFAKERPVVSRSGTWIMRDDDRLPLEAGEAPQMRRVRLRTLGCYPLTGAIDSDAATLDDILAEMRAAPSSERQGRLIDKDESASMEKKKREGYF